MTFPASRAATSAAAILLLFSLLCTQVPLLNSLGLEFSIAIALVGAYLAGVVALRRSGREPDPGRDWGEELRTTGVCSGLMLIPLVVITANTLVVKNCAYAEGLLVYGLTVLPGVFFSLALGRLVAAGLLRRRLLIFTIVYLMLLLHIPWVTMTGPQVFAFNPITGFFPGVTYDENLPLDHRLWIHRGATVAAALFLLILARAVARSRTPGSSAAPRRMEFVAGIIGLTVAGAVFLFSGPLGLSSSNESIAAELGGKYESAHVVLHYSPEAVTDDEVGRLVMLHEFFYAELSRDLQLERGGIITSFVYASPEQKARLVGAGRTNFAKPWLRQVHINYGDVEHSLRHEMVHVLASEFGIPILGIGANIGLIEGLATAMEGTMYEETLLRLAAQIDAIGRAESVEDLFTVRGFVQSYPGVSYALAGSFVQYLITTHGIYGVRKLYRSGEFKGVTGKDLGELVQDWREQLKTVPVDSAELARSRYLFDRPSIFGKVCVRAVARADEKTRRLLQERRYGEALTSAAGSLEMSPRPTALMQYGAALFRLNRYKDLLALAGPKLLDTLAERTLAPLHLSVGDALWIEGATDSAAVHYRRLSDLRLSTPLTEAAQVRLRVLRSGLDQEALQRVMLGDVADSTALVDLRELGARGSADLNLVRYLAAKRRIRQKDFGGAIRELDLIRSLHDPLLEKERQTMLARSYYAQNEFQKAKSHFWQSLNHTGREADHAEVQEWIRRCDWMDQWKR